MNTLRRTKRFNPFFYHRISAVFFSLVLVLLFSACSTNSKSALADQHPDSSSRTLETGWQLERKRIGISKIVQHPALDVIEQGIQDELKALGFEANFDFQNANGDVQNASKIADKFLREKVDLAVGISTPSAQALVQKLTEIPVIYTASSDPVVAGLVKSYEVGGKNVTGYSDATAIKTHLELLLRLKPETKRLGYLYMIEMYRADEMLDKTRALASELGIELIASGMYHTGEFEEAILSIADKVDAYYLGADYADEFLIEELNDFALKRKQAVLVATYSLPEPNDTLLTIGFSYYKLGRATGKLIASILWGDKKTIDFPTQYLTAIQDLEVQLNLDIAAKLGIAIPQDILDAASIIVKDGKVKTRQ